MVLFRTKIFVCIMKMVIIMIIINYYKKTIKYETYIYQNNTYNLMLFLRRHSSYQRNHQIYIDDAKLLNKDTMERTFVGIHCAAFHILISSIDFRWIEYKSMDFVDSQNFLSGPRHNADNQGVVIGYKLSSHHS